MKYLSLILLTTLLIPSFRNKSAAGRETVTELTYTTFDGGRGGGFSTIKITKAYVLYETGRTGLKSIYSEPTDPKFWKQLAKIDLKEFDKIGSGERNAQADGTDVELQITTNLKTHSFVNGNYQNSRKIKKLIAALQQEMIDIAKPTNRKYPE